MLIVLIIAIAAIVIGFVLLVIGYNRASDWMFNLGPWFGLVGVALLVITIIVAMALSKTT